jgi:hypothetical protein
MRCTAPANHAGEFRGPGLSDRGRRALRALRALALHCPGPRPQSASQRSETIRALAIILVILSAILLAAHFLHAGILPLVLISLVLPLLLLAEGRWAPPLLQLALALGALEWARTLLVLVMQRQAAGRPFLRLALILAAVTALTALAALLARRGWGKRCHQP